MVQRGHLADVGDESLKRKIERHTCAWCGKRWVVEQLARDCEAKHESDKSA